MATTTRGRRFPSEPLSGDEVRALLATFKGNLGIRNRAMTTLMYHTGVRISETLALRPCDVGDDSLRVLRGKGGKARTVGLTIEAKNAVDNWLQRRHDLAIDSDLIFTTLRGVALRPNAIREMLKTAGRRAGIAKRVHPHGLRASFAVACSRQLPINLVQEALGHSFIQSTAIYLAGLRGQSVDAVRAVQF